MLKRRFANIWERLTRDYRLVVYDNESLSQTRAVMVKPLTVWTIGVASVLVVAFLSGLVLAYFPAFQKSIPGLIVGSSSEYKELQEKNLELERQVVEMDSMLNVLHTAMGAGGKGISTATIKMYEALPEEGEDPAIAGNASGNEAGSPVSGGASANKSVQSHFEGAGGVGSSQALEVPTWRLDLLSPVKGILSRDFDPKRPNGHIVQITTSEDAMVRSVADGVVFSTEYAAKTGYVVGVWHHHLGLISFYRQTKTVLKPLGAFVFAGEPVAIAGGGGPGKAVLGFELWRNDHAVDPKAFMKLD